MRIFVGKAYVDVTGRGRSPRYWMQDRNLKEDNCFKNKNIMNLDCTAELCKIWLSGYCSMRPSVKMIMAVLV